MQNQKRIDQQLISILIDKESEVDLKEVVQKYLEDKETQANARIENLSKERDALNGQLLITA